MSQQQMFCRERRSWTAKEDQLLREAVQKEDPDNSNPSKWHAIAKHVPNRTNKDCRKRWFAKMASDVVKGGWAPDEDEKLVKGIERYGTRWSLVASVVQTRNSDQCAKRWTDTLNPAIDRTTWTPEADSMLVKAVAEHGKVWTKIVKTYFPGRTGLSAKNRYNSITRFQSDVARAPRRRKTSEAMYAVPRPPKVERGSPSSSSESPESPSMSLPFSSSSSSFQSTKAPRYDNFSNNWSSSSSVSSEEAPSFRSSPMTFDYVSSGTNTAPSTPPTEGAYPTNSYDLSMNHHNHLSNNYSSNNYSDPTQIVYSSASPPLPSSNLFKNFSNLSHHVSDSAHNYGSYSQYSMSHNNSSEAQDHFVFPSTAAVDAGSPINASWESASSKVANGGYKLPPSNEFSVRNFPPSSHLVSPSF